MLQSTSLNEGRLSGLAAQHKAITSTTPCGTSLVRSSTGGVAPDFTKSITLKTKQKKYKYPTKLNFTYICDEMTIQLSKTAAEK